VDWVIIGCGYVGERLAERLLSDGERVRAGRRDVRKVDALAARGASLHAIDLARPRTLMPLFHGTQVPIVVYSAPPVAGMPPGEAIRRAGDAAQRVSASRFIYLGSTAVYGSPAVEGAWVDEDEPVAISDAEAQPRISEESAVELLATAGHHTAVLRLAAIYGPGRGVRERLRAGTYQLIDDGRHFYSRVHVDDLVRVIRAVAARAPARALYNVADDRPTTQLEYTEWLCARLGLPLPPSVPSLAPGKPRRPIRNRRISNARCKRELALAFEYPSFVEGELAIENEEAASKG
jgi:nucleoside-diphosphate-sugar epimerase